MNTPCKIEKPASLRSGGVQVHPGMPSASLESSHHSFGSCRGTTQASDSRVESAIMFECKVPGLVDGNPRVHEARPCFSLSLCVVFGVNGSLWRRDSGAGAERSRANGSRSDRHGQCQ